MTDVDTAALRALVTDDIARVTGFTVAGLSPRTFELPHWTIAASSSRLRTRLEAWEAVQDNPRFEARNLERVLSPFAFELTSAYVALREWAPGVAPCGVDFRSSFMTTPSYRMYGGISRSFAVNAGLLRRLGARCGARTLGELSEEMGVSVSHLVRVGIIPDWPHASWETRPRDLRSSGLICLAPFATGPRSMRTRHDDIVEYWDRADRGMFRPVKIRRRVSYQTNLLVHEFGHQVDGELLALGFEAAEHVYGELSVALFRIPRPHVRQWNRHLLNWTGNSSWLLAGPGDTPAHAVARRDTTLPLLRKQIGSWKVQNRDEVFAEAFALSFTSADPDLRQRLAGFRTALADVGLMCRRRPGPA